MRAEALAHADAYFERGDFVRDVARRVAFRTASQDPAGAPALQAYLADELAPTLAALGFAGTIHPNPEAHGGPLLIAVRHEDDALPTVLMYGHGDVIRGQDASWTAGRGPWDAAVDGDRLYGRGTADNKGQHSINLAALAQVLAVRGRLGFNVKWLFETSEETGSPGLAAFCAEQRQLLAADVLIASDGPRLHAADPTVFLGSRGVANFDLTLTLRDGAHHSGNWGGLLKNPGTVLAHAIAAMVDGRGRILVDALRPPPIPDNVRAALAGLEVGGDAGDPAIDADWGEPGLTPAERVFAWNTLDVLAYRTGNPDFPINAIPPSAKAQLHMRFVVGTDIARLREHVRAHLDARGYGAIEIGEPMVMPATRLDPDDPWVRCTLASLERTAGRRPVLLPNLGGSLPNDVFADGLGLPTVWIPHSYPACQQHAPDEHLLLPVAREGLKLMTGLFWDLGKTGPGCRGARAGAKSKLPLSSGRAGMGPRPDAERAPEDRERPGRTRDARLARGSHRVRHLEHRDSRHQSCRPP
ncbi:MAG: M20 family metallopeptidase [Proteobacteria bacterium]|nr:M20 family metallopeptidase [Pseudomonadota bacterium]